MDNVSQWDVATKGSLCLESVRLLHQPPEGFRISSNQYPAGTSFTEASRTSRRYVVSGACSFTIGASAWMLRAGDILRIPKGTYEVRVLGSDPVELVSVWELPLADRAVADEKPEFHGRAITILCTDLTLSTTFYKHVLGATAIPLDHGTTGWYQLGSLRFSLVENAVERNVSAYPEHAQTMLWLDVADLSQAAGWFRSHDVPIIDKGDGWWMMIADPDGVLIEVWESRANSQVAGD